MTPLVLASASPRRRQLLEELGFVLEIIPADIDETWRRDEPADTYARRLAITKAGSVAQPGRAVLAADTVVSLDAAVLGKPVDQADFRRTMGLLSGKTHQVFTAVAVKSPTLEASIVVATSVSFRMLSGAEIEWYWGTGEPRDKAGGYAIQGKGGAFVARIDGSHSNVIGLPLVETLELLKQAGVRAPWAATS